MKAFVYYNSFSSWGWLDSLPVKILKEIEVIPGDIRDSEKVKEAMQKVEGVFHLAALIAIPYSYSAVQSYIDTNVSGTMNVLNAANNSHNIRKVLITSTSEVYGTAQYAPIDEKHPRQPQSPYAASKIGADALAYSFHRAFDLPLTIVRPFNTYGPRQSARAVIPTIISQLMKGKEKIELGNTKPTRDYVFVEDTAAGFETIYRSDSMNGEEVNIASQQEISIGDLAGMLIQLINPAAKILSKEERLRPDSSEVFRLLGSNRKLLEHTGWQPGTSLKEGLEKTIEWFRNSENLSGYKHGIYNV